MEDAGQNFLENKKTQLDIHIKPPVLIVYGGCVYGGGVSEITV